MDAHTNVYDFAAIAAAVGYEIRPTIPRTRAHLPPISAWVDIYEPEGRFLGAGIVIAHDPDPHKVVVQVDGAQHIAHYTDLDWAQIGGAACP
jgi:hypothetical protein